MRAASEIRELQLGAAGRQARADDFGVGSNTSRMTRGLVAGWPHRMDIRLVDPSGIGARDWASRLNSCGRFAKNDGAGNGAELINVMCSAQSAQSLS